MTIQTQVLTDIWFAAVKWRDSFTDKWRGGRFQHSEAIYRNNFIRALAAAKEVEPQPERQPLTDEQRIQNLADLTRWLDGLGSNIHTYSLRGIALAAWEAHSKAVEPQPERELKADHAEQHIEMVPAQQAQKPLGWYCVDKTGMATLCADEDDAKQSAKLAAQDWPRHAPYIATQLYTAPSRELVQQALDAMAMKMPPSDNPKNWNPEFHAAIANLDAWLEQNKPTIDLDALREKIHDEHRTGLDG